jgi:hypothetical protein
VAEAGGLLLIAVSVPVFAALELTDGVAAAKRWALEGFRDSAFAYRVAEALFPDQKGHEDAFNSLYRSEQGAAQARYGYSMASVLIFQVPLDERDALCEQLKTKFGRSFGPFWNEMIRLMSKDKRVGRTEPLPKTLFNLLDL